MLALARSHGAVASRRARAVRATQHRLAPARRGTTRTYASEPRNRCPPTRRRQGIPPSAVRVLVVGPFIGANLLVFYWWQQALRAAAAGPGPGPDSPSYPLADRATTAAAVVNPHTVETDQRYAPLRHMLDHYTVRPENHRAGRWHTLLTSAVSHRDAPHLLCNLVSFHAFATCALAAGVPGARLGALMAGSAAAASAATLLHWRWRRREHHVVGLGASGVVAGLGTAAALVAPRARFTVFLLPFLSLRLWHLQLLFLAFDSGGAAAETESGIGHAAHLGGMACGAAFYLLALRRYGGAGSAAALLRRYLARSAGPPPAKKPPAPVAPPPPPPPPPPSSKARQPKTRRR
ncbi:hypothetical protein F4780DRAFT_774358 [Xylariomycetidae sp. FL0641]|nr:hypothetical protein F4780DRAFT_774358 [Xylariomycetidae sp. FL0641]